MRADIYPSGWLMSSERQQQRHVFIVEETYLPLFQQVESWPQMAFHYELEDLIYPGRRSSMMIR